MCITTPKNMLLQSTFYNMCAATVLATTLPKANTPCMQVGLVAVHHNVTGRRDAAIANRCAFIACSYFSQVPNESIYIYSLHATS